MIGIRAATGAIRVVENDTTGVGFYAADGSMRITRAPGGSFVGAYASDGSAYVTFTTSTTPLPSRAPDGSLYVSETQGITGALFVSGGSFDPLTLFAASEQGVWLENDPANDTLFQERTGASATTAVTTFGEVVGTRLDKSGNANHALAPSDAARGITGRVPTGGRRNLLTYSEDFSNAAWTTSNVTVTTDAIAASGTRSANADKLVENIFSGEHNVFQRPGAVDGVQYTFSVVLKSAGRTKAFFRTDITGSFLNTLIDLTTGTVTSATGHSGTSTDLGDGWWLFQVTLTASGTVGTRLTSISVDDGTATTTSAPSYTGDGSSGIYVEAAQFEVAASASAYQKVTTTYDVTESGVDDCWYIADDQVDDSYSITFPDLGTDCTVATVDQTGVTITTGQTIAAGAYTVPGPLRHYGLVIVNRALTAGETTNLTEYLEGLGE